MTEQRLLDTYLNDHLAAATAAVELAKRVCSSNQDNALSEPLSRVRSALAEDRGTLKEIMDQLGVGGDRLKLTAAWGAEKLGRLKLNGRLLGYSPLSRLEEIELLLLGVEGKLLLWEALRELPVATRVDASLGELVDRARSQRRLLRRLRLQAARMALA
jgi:hypothetical protein